MIPYPGSAEAPARRAGARVHGAWLVAVALLAACSAPPPPAAEVRIEYLAHACFAIASPAGSRVVIDPFNGHLWLGYAFPEGVRADAVLITHPHYDHDASYAVEGRPAVFRAAGDYAVGDLRIRGVAGRHAEPWGESFGRINTLWLIEVAGLRIAHLGDSGPLTPATVAALGRVDVLMLPIDGDEHILKNEQVAAIRDALRPAVTIPMHYQLPALSTAADDLGPIDPWLEGRDDVTRLDDHLLTLRADALPAAAVLVPRPAPSVVPWSADYRRARADAQRAREVFDRDPAAAEAAMRAAVERYPHAIVLWRTLGSMLAARGSAEQAVDALETGLALAGRDDWESTYSTRMLLARRYQDAGRHALAAGQARLVLEGSFDAELRARAAAVLADE